MERGATCLLSYSLDKLKLTLWENKGFLSEVFGWYDLPHASVKLLTGLPLAQLLTNRGEKRQMVGEGGDTSNVLQHMILKQAPL